MSESSFFSSIFCCCRQRSTSPDTADENSRLLPPIDELPIIDPNVTIVDQQHLRDKWTSIVRAKEGKMVNVNSILPFNLHNQTLPQHTYSASASRSRSLSTDRNSSRYASISRNPYASTSRTGGMLAPSPLHRTTELPGTHPRHASSSSNLRGEADGERDDGTGMERHVRSPLLGLRLVHPSGEPVSSSARLGEAVRGRSGWSPEGTQGERTEAEDEDEMTPRPPGIITRPQDIKLNLSDVSDIAVSWGD